MEKKPLARDEFVEEIGVLTKQELFEEALNTFGLPEDLVKGLSNESIIGLMWDKWEEDQKKQPLKQEGSELELVLLSDIRVDGGTQVREKVDSSTVVEYAEAMDHGKFPPVVVFFDGATYWMADGFHRYFAGRKREQESVYADVREGTDRDALLYAIGANAQHGLRRTNADKRRAVRLVLEDEEWSRRSLSEISRMTGGVSGAVIKSVQETLEKEAQVELREGESASKPAVGTKDRKKVKDTKPRDVMLDLAFSVDTLGDQMDVLLQEAEPKWLDEDGFAPEDVVKKIVRLITLCEKFNLAYHR